MKSYCTQNDGICESCSLSSYDKDCKNKQIVRNFNVRLTPDTIQKISELAKAQKRSVQNTIEMMVENEYKKLEESKMTLQDKRKRL